jgi:hypothetical protein
LINDPDASAPEVLNGDSNAMAGILSGFGGNPAAVRAPIHNVVSEELLNNTLAGFPGGAEAFWDGMQGSGIGREELLQMLATEMYSLSLLCDSDLQGSSITTFNPVRVTPSTLPSFPTNLATRYFINPTGIRIAT